MTQIPFPFSLSYEAPNAWLITEHLGDQRIGQGRLRYHNGQFIITGPSGTTTYGQSWQAAIIDHLRRR
ncbi:hypothetical protein [Frigoribacterium sp. RIT-PI-h]|uniref:hypothetical protein n=1 Tax=Frigoribacterium sp. RIT-PI-h TaxID=1690245 RepID=UPI0006B8BDFE|nr:hypothetical protein [Frigoribacterium sp. RIT-PI-h]KPG82327.1 hypothetical protein AEQ27_09410 [Frigoribacterium sp. RIT-PI-h]